MEGVASTSQLRAPKTSTIASTPSNEIVERLRNSLSYANNSCTVDTIETHSSWVFLTDRFAFKLKKPVRFEFLDFSTPELRRRACLEEVQLNRRLAPDVYLGVLPITQDSAGILALDGNGQPIDWVVQMRRLPVNQTLDVVLREDRLTVEHIQSIAKLLTDFYSKLLRKSISPDEYHEALDRHIRANGVVLLGSSNADKSRIRRIQTAQLLYLNVEADLFGSRATEGRIVEGHGDLRPEHIYLNGRPIVIDCIEFSDELRTLDFADEISFLGMECQRLGSDGLGELILAEYETKCGDHVPPSLFVFYQCYRATVRAKVALLREVQMPAGAEGASTDLAAQYIDLADRYAEQLGPSTLLIVGGLMGSGKSTLAANLTDALAGELLSTDHIRHGSIGSSAVPEGYGQGNYQPGMRHRVYNELFRHANELLKDGQSVVLDGTFLTCSLRDRAYELAARNGAVSVHVQCACPPEVAHARIQKRAEAGQSESEARTELYDLQAQDLESPWADEPSITIDTTYSLPQQLRAVFDELKRHGNPCAYAKSR
jgi:aminoglycoside phosphotransferase family enzyme/predicted kinase